MIDVKIAVNAAYEYIKAIQDLVDSSIGLGPLRLEEVELSEDKSFWLITLGFDIPKKPPKSRLEDSTSLASTPVLYERGYKLFKVNSETGKVEAMKIRQV
ncbi:hypothetical protein [Nostoc sp. JL33]|uniref:hypothetical protein n=1 Tax=Nostoc sp. JL33 TaxID=2815396 RepID=UPI0025D7BE49|nr:hypothetical protein [Nostoc sp. JL33]MBN3873626.1 hypothetical protein [Nostoc sp. JL33]